MSTRIKIKPTKSGVKAMVLVKHPMETGLRKDKKTGEKIPAHFITSLLFKVNGEQKANLSLSQGVSKNPFVAVELAEAKSGDVISVEWVDNTEQSGSAEATVK